MISREQKIIEQSLEALNASQQQQFPYCVEEYGLSIYVYKGVFSIRHFTGWRVFIRCFPTFTGRSVLEMGCGCGVTSIYLGKNGAASVLAVDVSADAVANTRHNIVANQVHNVEARISDLFSSVHEQERFDLVYWNYPFLWKPTSYRCKTVLERGLFDPGYTMLERFLREVPLHLEYKGSVLLGWGEGANNSRLRELCLESGLSYRVLASEVTQEMRFELCSLSLLGDRKGAMGSEGGG